MLLAADLHMHEVRCANINEKIRTYPQYTKSAGVTKIITRTIAISRKLEIGSAAITTRKIRWSGEQSNVHKHAYAYDDFSEADTIRKNQWPR